MAPGVRGNRTSHKVSHHPSGDPLVAPPEHWATLCLNPQDEQGLEFICSVTEVFLQDGQTCAMWS